LGTVVGAVVGGLAGGAGSGAAVVTVDRVDNDNTITGIGHGATPDVGQRAGQALHTPVVDNGVPGVQTGGRAIYGTPDTRGVGEKVADAVTGDAIDDKTGKPVA
jgi:hypothetical protein